MTERMPSATEIPSQPDKGRDQQGHAEDDRDEEQAPGIVGGHSLGKGNSRHESLSCCGVAVDSPRGRS
jgi:hypothetical protein